ncbi:BlaI/MecI/CopY family transcriptional regulator [Neglectibacter timonensis]|uniref:BlaI/MecI/CopY family transcriptional regulator n=1 Tax=Neglectibacter timonensis TaxID=1776382 RepID=A0ABT1S190_9FIRM|nr:BlaI/MecI/CopY family transcriptional regulator [Neglectibacter timonensis]MCQ4840605.1 BlaI/MecI/CopY family transcriptional regulator [Neglectibacter timonensis]MCQ4844783.1 BlaI/MecI/CopY family transcriptional regulator [Neglectibacter timonensis]MEE0731607.1 BlaI/MecI/CopY family transcriptional regulator [Oscillospiraceae bacterium]
MERKNSPSASAEEWKLMTLLWEAPRTLMQMVEALKEEKGWAKSTVATMLNRMQKKGLIHYEERGRARLYFPAVEQEAVALRETHSFLQRVYRGSVGMMLNALLEEDRLSQEEIEELHEILRKADR